MKIYRDERPANAIPIRYEAGVIETPSGAPRRSLQEMAQSAAKTFALQLPPEPLSFGRDRFAEYMAGVIEALLLTAARGEYRPAALPISEQYPRQVIYDGSVWHAEPEVIPEGAFQGLEKVSAEVGSQANPHPMRPGTRFVGGPFATRAEAKAAMYRAAGLDPDGAPAPLPKKPEPEERPFVPNKWGEHGDD